MDLASTTTDQNMAWVRTDEQRFASLCRTTERRVAENFVNSWWSAKSNGSIADGSFHFTSESENEFEWKSFQVADLVGSWIRYGADLKFRNDAILESIDPPWIFTYCIAGHAIDHKTNIEHKRGDAGAFRSNGSGAISLEDGYETLALQVPGRELEAAQFALYGSDAMERHPYNIKFEAGSRAALTLVRVITRLSEIPKYPQNISQRLERSAKESALFELLLMWPEAISTTIAQETALPASTRLARDFIHAHIGDLPTVSDVAASCRIGVRALDRGFKKHLGISPLNYMLALRLRGVHDDLIACRNGNTVTEVATFWGFANLGVFAARYQERFGELPSNTLRQSRLSRRRLN